MRRRSRIGTMIELKFLLSWVASLLFVVAMWRLFSNVILPWVVKRKTVETEVNPKWIKSKVEGKYGFQDIDFILARSPFNNLPYMKVTNKDETTRFQFILSEDTSINDVNEMARLALAGKIYVKYHVLYMDKPLFWLSILCYMLDGGDINESKTAWSEKG